jgi:hypothetical protein
MALSSDGETRRRVADNVRFLTGVGAPTNGDTGAGIAGSGSLYFDINSGIIYVNEGAISSPEWVVFGISNIADGSILTAMIADLAVTAAKLGPAAVTTSKLDALAVDTAALAALAVTNAKIAALAVDSGKLAADAVITAKILDLNVTAAKIAANTITPAKVATSFFAQATGTISSADITGTGVGQFGHANGFPLVAPPGLHVVGELISGVLIYDFAVAAYGAGGNVTINRSGGAGALTGLISAANFCGAVVDKIAFLIPLSTAGINLTENEGINLVSTAAFTQPGTAVGVIRYILNYRLHSTGL